MKSLIFGINSQDGFYLNQLCGEKKIDVVGVSRSHGNWEKGSVSDFNFVENMIKKNRRNISFIWPRIHLHGTTHFLKIMKPFQRVP